MASKNEAEDTENLGTIFQEALDLYNNLGRIDEPTNSSSVQCNVKRSMRLFEKATQLVSLAGVFSDNESIEEIPTNDLQYLLLPAFLGSLSLKLTSGERKHIIDVAEIYFKDYLQRCREYGLTNHVLKDDGTNKTDDTEKSLPESENLTSLIYTRYNKIQRFKAQKELKSKLEDLKQNLQNEHADEDIKRNYFLTLIKLYIYEAIDELNSIELEKPILEHMMNLKKENKVKEKRVPPQPIRPFIITKDEVQKAVFGAGYPSLPTMTVQEFYDKRVKDGVFPDPNKKPSGQLSLQEASLAGISLYDQDEEDEEKEQRIENDDPESLARMRNMDEFKDEHRRGYGNRMNRS